MMFLATYLGTYNPRYLHSSVPTFLGTYIPSYLHTQVPRTQVTTYTGT